MAKHRQRRADGNHQRTAIPGLGGQADHVWFGGEVCPRSRAGRGQTAVAWVASSYSPGRIGMMSESSSASDQASAGAAAGSTGISDMRRRFTHRSQRRRSQRGVAVARPARGPKCRPDRSGQVWPRRGDDECTRLLRQSPGHERDAGATTHRRDRRQVAEADSVALQHVVEEADETVQRLPDRIFEIITGQPDFATIARHLGGQLGRIRRRKPFLGVTASGPQLTQRTDRRRRRRVERPRQPKGSPMTWVSSAWSMRLTGELRVPDSGA